jgi:hypothetical protein
MRVVRPNEKLSDCRWNRVLAANPASDPQGHPKRKRGAAVLVKRIVIPSDSQSGEKMLRDTRPFSTRKMTEVQLLAF